VLHLACEPVSVSVIADHQRSLGHAGLAPEPDLSPERRHALSIDAQPCPPEAISPSGDIGSSDDARPGKRVNRRYARQPARSDGRLAPRRSGCSVSGHSRSPTARPTLWICR
jgi:hypothetical protein